MLGGSVFHETLLLICEHNSCKSSEKHLKRLLDRPVIFYSFCSLKNSDKIFYRRVALEFVNIFHILVKNEQKCDVINPIMCKWTAYLDRCLYNWILLSKKVAETMNYAFHILYYIPIILKNFQI